MQLNRIIISRTDSIGDVVLTLPLAGVLKKIFPSSEVYFLGKAYTRPVIEACEHVTQFLCWDEISENPSKEQLKLIKNLNADAVFHVFPDRAIADLMQKAKVPLRIGTGRRWFHLLTCNKKVFFTRRKSSLHEAQLNLKLLEGIYKNTDYPLSSIPGCYGLTKTQPLPGTLAEFPDKNRFNLVLHPRSKGSAVEWGLQNFEHLIGLLPPEKFKLFITGTAEEGRMIRENITRFPSHAMDLTGKMSLRELISFIKETDGLVAASTGPLHIASALGKHALGLYSPRKPIHAGRWGPVGAHSRSFLFDENCEKCNKGQSCKCIQQISPEVIANHLKEVAS